MATFRPMAPTAQARRRLPECGRIRLGIRTIARSGKEKPERIQTLRFTSETRPLIDALAGIHGGQVKPWRNGTRDEFEVISDAAEIPVILPPDPIGDGAIYELWGGGSLQRRCDGVTAVCPTRVSDDEVAMVERECICNAKERVECKVTLRLNVIIPDIPFAGVWRCDTHSWNAEKELPGMVEALHAFASAGFSRAIFGVRAEESMIAGRKQHFNVPYLRTDASVQQALEGAGAVAAIAAVPLRQIGPAPLPCGHYEENCPCDSQEVTVDPGLGTCDPVATPESGRGGGAPAAPVTDPDVYSKARAKHMILAITNGDVGEAREVWEWAGWAGRASVLVGEFQAAMQRYSREKYRQPEPDEEIVEAEVVDESGAPF